MPAIPKCWQSVGLCHNLLRGREVGYKYPDFSSHSHHYALQNPVISASAPHLLATIGQSPTGC